MSKKLSKIKEFDIWDNDGIVSPPTKEDMEDYEPPPPSDENTMNNVSSRGYIMPRKKHRFLRENVERAQELKKHKYNEDEDIEEDIDSEKAQEYWTQKYGFHFRTCPVCKAYVKGKCWRCGSEPGEPHPELYHKNDYSVRRNVEGYYISRDRGVERNVGISEDSKIRFLKNKKYNINTSSGSLRNLGNYARIGLRKRLLERKINKLKIKKAEYRKTLEERYRADRMKERGRIYKKM